jgi:hypothetical protein
MGEKGLESQPSTTGTHNVAAPIAAPGVSGPPAAVEGMTRNPSASASMAGAPPSTAAADMSGTSSTDPAAADEGK